MKSYKFQYSYAETDTAAHITIWPSKTSPVEFSGGRLRYGQTVIASSDLASQLAKLNGVTIAYGYADAIEVYIPKDDETTAVIDEVFRTIDKILFAQENVTLQINNAISRYAEPVNTVGSETDR